MAQLFFKYGTMNSGKSFELLKVAYNYEEQGKDVMIFSPSVDDRAGHQRVGSRVGLSRASIPIDADTDIYDIVKKKQPTTEPKTVFCVLIDEAQFLQKQHIEQLTRIVDELGIPVMAFGLKNDFQNHLFEGSYYLLIYADKIEEMKTICWYCDRKATMVIRFKDGIPVFEGEQIQVGGNDTYKPACRKCYARIRNESERA